MAKPVIPLTDTRVQKAKPEAKPYRLHDGGGLALLVAPSGVKSWQLRYKLDGKAQTATLGKLGVLTLADARTKAADLRKVAESGEHLTAHKRTMKAQAVIAKQIARDNTFDAMAKSWMVRQVRRKKWSGDYRVEVRASIDNHLADLLPLPVNTIFAETVFPILDKVERNAPMMAEKVARRLHAVMDHAVRMGAIKLNPLPRREEAKTERKHFPAVSDVATLGAILRDARAADPCKGIVRAHLLLAFTALRVSEVVGAKWSEFDLDGVQVPNGDELHTFRVDKATGNWNVPRERMKRKDEERGPHIVPLPPALLKMLREWHDVDGKDAVYVCPAPRDPTKPITPEGVEKFYRDKLGLGGKHSPHSWRSAFSTVAREAGKDSDAIEAQLDHVVGTKVAAAYDRSMRVELRRSLMTWYESTLIAARDGAAVIPITRAAK